MSEEEQRLQELYQRIGLNPDPRLREVLEAGLRESFIRAENDYFISVPFLILGILFVGKHRPQDQEFVTQFYNAFGPEETDTMAKRVNQLHASSSHSNPEEEMAWASLEFLDTLVASKSSISDEVVEVSPEDVVITLLEKRPIECQILFPQHIDTWETLLSATRKAFAGMAVKESTKRRLLEIERRTKGVPTTAESSSPQFSRPPSQSYKEWRKYLKIRYGKKFTDAAIRIIIAAVEAADKQQGTKDNLFAVNTKHLLLPFVKDPGPLLNLHLGSHAGVDFGLPFWHEAQSHEFESDEDRIVYGKTRPSVEFAAILQTAAGLADTTTGFPEVTEWHLAFAAISSQANGLNWQLRAGKSSLSAAANALRRNLVSHQPKLEPLFNWSDLEDDYEPFSEESIEESEVADASSEPEVSVPTGILTDFSRDSTSAEIDGDTKKLARAIASTFKSAKTGDFCFGLFGPWGRGKTTLIREVADELRSDHVSVAFNAWKYPSRPEVWVWLYETIKAQASGTDLWNRLRIGIQSNLRRDQGFGFLFPGILLLFAAIPKGQLTGWLIPLDNLAAILALSALIFYGYRLWNSFGTLLRDYLKMPNHGRHLGLQAAIGDDLKHLLATWTGVGRSTSGLPTSQDIVPSLLPTSRWKYFCTLVTWHWPFTVGLGLVITSLVWIIFRVWDPAGWSLRVLLIGAAAASIAGFVAVLLPPRRAKKILLIVDDLDRCPPEEMLNVIEALRVFLDDPAISSHLKIAMLLDREILSHAICHKYEKLIQAKDHKADQPSSTQHAQGRFTREGIVAEQIEKFFILSFDMPPLAFSSSWKIASSIVGYTESTEEANSSDKLDEQDELRTDTPEGQHIHSTTTETTEGGNSSGTPPAPAATDSLNTPTPEIPDAVAPVEEVLLSEDEKKAMMRLLHSLITTDPAHATPRRMRMIKMRYFLARQILRAQDNPFNPEGLLKHFSGIYIDRKLDPKLAVVVGMVTGKTPEQ